MLITGGKGANEDEREKRDENTEKYIGRSWTDNDFTVKINESRVAQEKEDTQSFLLFLSSLITILSSFFGHYGRRDFYQLSESPLQKKRQYTTLEATARQSRSTRHAMGIENAIFTFHAFLIFKLTYL